MSLTKVKRRWLLISPCLKLGVWGTVQVESTSTAAAGIRRWALPDRLEEISGLSMTQDGRLLAHNDEHSIVYEINPDDGSITKSFQVGDQRKPLVDDFEGIAVSEEQVYLLTSTGRLYAFTEGADGESVLVAEAGTESVVIFHWSVDT